MTVIGLDLGTHTGYCVVIDGEITASGVWDFTRAPGEHYGHMFNKLLRNLNTMDNNLSELDYVSYELAHHRGGAASRIGVGMNCAVLQFSAETGTPVKEVHTMTLKKWATGSGKAKKPEMQQKAKEYLGRHPKDDNEGDAVLVAMRAYEEETNEEPSNKPAF